MIMKRIGAALAALLLVTALLLVATAVTPARASTAAADPAIAAAQAVATATAAADLVAIADCVNERTGLKRTLEKGNLPKSRWGKCRDTETKVIHPVGSARTIVWKWPDRTETCNRSATTDDVWTYSCTVKPAASPSPTTTAPAS
ncbi:hypothetical protein Aph01nite_74140 [Acrocarpospora phusangensis]|uniref:Ig-like domain-containing protein n=1 Tax=Acrocarpospora phusangensis TaxID=1070424 RepID=A0A919UPR9_9ACTN|nr:hypothetical protein [Acrocarpospora phusangensis]GIH29104.1 hypothetical protein Aph01nite_74140 [Acrocarpospora phusangensis]